MYLRRPSRLRSWRALCWRMRRLPLAEAAAHGKYRCATTSKSRSSECLFRTGARQRRTTEIGNATTNFIEGFDQILRGRILPQVSGCTGLERTADDHG